jgi:hypothetical protein
MTKLIAALLASTFALGAYAQNAAAPAVPATPATPAVTAAPAATAAKAEPTAKKAHATKKSHRHAGKKAAKKTA